MTIRSTVSLQKTSHLILKTAEILEKKIPHSSLKEIGYLPNVNEIIMEITSIANSDSITCTWLKCFLLCLDTKLPPMQIKKIVLRLTQNDLHSYIIDICKMMCFLLKQGWPSLFKFDPRA